METGAISGRSESAQKIARRITRVLLVDAQGTVRRGLKMRLSLEHDMAIVGEASSETDALALAQALGPDVVVMDPDIPGIDGYELARKLCRLCPGAALVLSGIHGDPETRMWAQEAGAVSYVEKQGGIGSLLSAIRQAS